MTDDQIRLPVLSSAQRQYVLGHLIEATPVHRAQLRKPLSWKVKGNDAALDCKHWKQRPKTLRGTARAVNKQDQGTFTRFLNMPTMRAT
jgi:hypothetical protein